MSEEISFTWLAQRSTKHLPFIQFSNYISLQSCVAWIHLTAGILTAGILAWIHLTAGIHGCADYVTNPNRILLKKVYELLQQREMY